jgi:hypothetical protein
MVHQQYAPLQGQQFLYLVHLFRMSSSVSGSPISVNLPQHRDDDAVPDLFLFLPGKLSTGEFEHGHVVRNPAVFMMLDTLTDEVLDLGSKYLLDTYDKTPPEVGESGASTTSPAYSKRDGSMVQLRDVYEIIETEMRVRGVRNENEVALILQSCRVSSDGSSIREPSPTRDPKYMPNGGKKKKQRRRQTRNRKYKVSKKKSTKRVRRS